MTLSTLTEMTDRVNEGALRPAPIPTDKKSLEFIRAVLKHSIAPSKIADLVKTLREMRSDVQTCVTKLEATFQHVHTLYDIMRSGLTPTTSRTSFTSTSTNLTVRMKLAAWLKGREGIGGAFKQSESTSVSHPVSSQASSHFIFGFSFVDILKNSTWRLRKTLTYQMISLLETLTYFNLNK